MKTDLLTTKKKNAYQRTIFEAWSAPCLAHVENGCVTIPREKLLAFIHDAEMAHQLCAENARMRKWIADISDVMDEMHLDCGCWLTVSEMADELLADIHHSSIGDPAPGQCPTCRSRGLHHQDCPDRSEP